MASSSLWKLRRLGARSASVFDRHKEIASVGAYADSLVPRTQGYLAAYDATTRYTATWRREMAEGKTACAALLGSINEWKPHLGRENPSFNLSDIGDRPTVPEDLIEDAERLRDAIGQVRRADGTTPDWVAGALTTLSAQIEAADKETGEAAMADSEFNRLSREMNHAATELDGELQRFRRTLGAALGRNHPDFQKLRAERASAPDSDDEGGPPPPAPT